MACKYYYDRAPLPTPQEENLGRQPNQGQMGVRSKTQTQQEEMLPKGQDKAKRKTVKWSQQTCKETGDKTLSLKGKELAKQNQKEGIVAVA